MLAFIKENPLAFAGLVAVLLSSVANLIIKHWGQQNDRLKRVLSFIVDLLSLIPGKGSPSKGLQLPLVSVSVPPKKKYEDAVRRAREGGVILPSILVALLVYILCFACLVSTPGCQSARNRTLSALTSLSRVTLSVGREAGKICDSILRQCIADKENPCEALQKCHKVEKESIRSSIAAHLLIVAALEALSVNDETKASDYLAKAVHLLDVARVALKPYGISL